MPDPTGLAQAEFTPSVRHKGRFDRINSAAFSCLANTFGKTSVAILQILVESLPANCRIMVPVYR